MQMKKEQGLEQLAGALLVGLGLGLELGLGLGLGLGRVG